MTGQLVSAEHTSVFLYEAVENMQLERAKVVVDATFGRGGHSHLILSKLAEDARLIAIDRDLTAINVAKSITDKRFAIWHSEFSNLRQIIDEQGLLGKVDAILLDLGVSSPQLDQAERGFSFNKDGPLDMRMNTTQNLTAASWLQQATQEEIAWVLKFYGEEKFANRIASVIVTTRETSPITTTFQLAELIKQQIPYKEKNKNPATRSFQAIRIFINNELGELEQLLADSLDILAPNGRLVVISFHSLEDRIVKRFIRKQTQGIQIPKGLPLTEAQIDRKQALRAIGKAQKVSTDAKLANIRARSAVLRVAERI